MADYEKSKATGEIEQFEDVGSLERGRTLNHEEDPARIKAILRKCDIRILPVMSILYALLLSPFLSHAPDIVRC
jgi:hypothetical protein